MGLLHGRQESQSGEKYQPEDVHPVDGWPLGLGHCASVIDLRSSGFGHRALDEDVSSPNYGGRIGCRERSPKKIAQKRRHRKRSPSPGVDAMNVLVHQRISCEPYHTVNPCPPSTAFLRRFGGRRLGRPRGGLRRGGGGRAV